MHNFKVLKKNKNRYLLYLIILIAVGLYLVFYLDAKRFHNIRKTLFSFGKPIDLIEFDKIVKSTSTDNYFEAQIQIHSGEPYIEIPGFDSVLISRKNKNIRKRNGFHPSVNLTLFSMGYASDYLIENYYNNMLCDSKVEILEEIYITLYKEIIKPFSVNSNTVNDHAITERIQFLIIFYSYIKENYPEKKDLLRYLTKDINICLGFLTNEKFFTWRTNHGLMQLRSLAQVACACGSLNVRNSLLSLFAMRMNDVIPYHLGPDGAVYEGASGYWVFIYKQFLKITEIECVQNLSSIILLKEKLKESKHFIDVVTTNDGYLQGMGDSYSRYTSDTSKNTSIKKNRYFKFSNQLIGANWSTNNKHLGVLFASLDVSLNVHKLPEDLAVYLYFNYPVFTNTGTYSYDISPVRNYFKTEASQSTVMFLDSTAIEPLKSEVNIKDFDRNTNTLSALGFKQYTNGKEIYRMLDIDPDNGITITDSTRFPENLMSFYNIHPEVMIERISNTKIRLITTDYSAIDFYSNNDIEIIEGIISNTLQEIVDIKRLKIIGSPIRINITFPELNFTEEMNFITGYSPKESRTHSASLNRLKYYTPSNKQIKSDFINRSIILFISSLVLIFGCELIYRFKV